MPFGIYESFAACVAANQDQENPDAYCAAIQQQAEKCFTVVKADDTRHTVYGWASVAIKQGDDLLVDYQDDMIEPAELEKAAEQFVLTERLADEMHSGEPIGQMVESFVVTPEKLDKMGLQRTHAPKVAWWVGFKVAPAVYEKVKRKELRMFSIFATAERVSA